MLINILHDVLHTLYKVLYLNPIFISEWKKIYVVIFASIFSIFYSENATYNIAHVCLRAMPQIAVCLFVFFFLGGGGVGG